MFNGSKKEPSNFVAPDGVRHDVAGQLTQHVATGSTYTVGDAAVRLSRDLPADDPCIELIPCNLVRPNGSWAGLLAQTPTRLILVLLWNDLKTGPEIVRAVPLGEVSAFKGGKRDRTGEWYITLEFAGESYLLTSGNRSESAELDRAVQAIGSAAKPADPYTL